MEAAFDPSSFRRELFQVMDKFGLRKELELKLKQKARETSQRSSTWDHRLLNAFLGDEEEAGQKVRKTLAIANSREKEAPHVPRLTPLTYDTLRRVDAERTDSRSPCT